jgi:transcriptional regulator with XRE-family HTH domain
MHSVRGHRVRQLRERLERTQLWLAETAHLSQSHLSQIEQDKVQSVGSAVLNGLARALDTSVDYLIGATDDPRPPKSVAIGRIKPDEEELMLAYRQIKRESLKELIRESARRWARLEQSFEQEALQDKSPSLAPDGHGDRAARPE